MTMTTLVVESVRKDGTDTEMQENKQPYPEKIAVIGGDRRTRAMSERLRALGCDVEAIGNDGEGMDGIAAILSDARAVILPTPSFVEDHYVFGTQPPLDVHTLFSLVGDRTAVYGGRISGAIWQVASSMGVRLTDYMQLEEVQLRNAIPSAEGAIYLAMQEMSVTLQGSRMAILGYGRIGRALAQRLASWGAQVSVAVRRRDALEQVQSAGYTPIFMENGLLTHPLVGYDAVFNTVPARIIEEEALDHISAGTLLIELASAPGGWSPQAAARKDLRVIYAPGLPAKYAPDSAGALIADVLYERMRDGEEGVP